jgi:hypothetical protein
VGVSPTNQPNTNLITKYALNLKLGSSKIPHLLAGTPLPHISILKMIIFIYGEGLGSSRDADDTDDAGI